MPEINFSKKVVSVKSERNESNYVRYGQIAKNANVAYGHFSKYGNNCAIYGIVCKTTNKTYVGATKHLARRLMKHFNELFHNRHATKKFQEDFNKYGFDDFNIIIYSTDKNNLLEQEKQKQIEIGVPNLYNEKISGYYIDEEYRKKLANSDKSSHKTKEYREKMSKLKANKVAQYYLDGKLIKIWNSAVEICETLGHTRSVILCCCNGSKPRAYGYLWRYVDDNGNIVTDGYEKGRKRKK